MKISRDWVTPISAGAFLLSAVTGVLIFFHIDSGLNKTAHEWLSWVLLIAVALHLLANFGAFKRHWSSARGKLLMGTFALVLGLSFIGGGARSEPPFAGPVHALAEAPLTTLAGVVRLNPQQLNEKLAQAGLQPTSGQQSLRDLTGPDLRRQMQVLNQLLGQEPR